MAEDNLSYIQILKDHFEKVKMKNSNYSLRAFAMFLGLDPSLLSRILSEKEIPSLDTADIICQKLKLPLEEAKAFMQSVADEKICISLHKINPDYTDCENED